MKKFLISVLFAFVLGQSNAQPSFVKGTIDEYIQQGLKDWDLPGLSVVIVKDGKIALMKGYGVKNLDSREPVDENTLFMIASNTKLFTGTALALLETRQKLNLNDKITKYFPDFRLYDTVTTKLVTIRDMLTHRIGTKTFQGDFTFWNTKLDRPEIMLVFSELMERARRDKRIAEAILPIKRKWRQILVELLTEGVSEGAFRPDLDPDAFATMVMSTMIGFCRNSTKDPDSYMRLTAEMQRAIRNPVSSNSPIKD